MMPFPNIAQDFELAAQVLKSTEQQNTLDDINHERSGVEVGRLKKTFHNGNTTTQQDEKRKTKEFLRQVTALQALLDSDPEYAKLYNDFKDLLSRAETATENLLERLRLEQEQIQQTIDDVLSRASQLPDGTKVFKHDDGQVYNEHHEIVDPELAEIIVWKEGSPAYSQYTNPIDKKRDLKNEMENALHYQVEVLGNAREEMEDPDNPMSKHRINELQESLIQQSTPAVRQEIAPDENASTQDNNLTNIPVKPVF